MSPTKAQFQLLGQSLGSPDDLRIKHQCFSNAWARSHLWGRRSRAAGSLARFLYWVERWIPKFRKLNELWVIMPKNQYMKILVMTMICKQSHLYGICRMKYWYHINQVRGISYLTSYHIYKPSSFKSSRHEKGRHPRLNNLCARNAIADTRILTTTDLFFVDRRNPADAKVDPDGDDTNDPYNLAVCSAVVAEDDSKDYTTEVARCTDNARDDTILSWLLMDCGLRL